MVAAASGNFALFSAVMHAVDRAIDKTAVSCACYFYYLSYRFMAGNK